MEFIEPGPTWDFSAALSLISSLDRRDGSSSPETPSLTWSESQDQGPEPENKRPTLGNFDRLWSFLGQPADLPPPAFKLVAPTSEEAQSSGSENKAKTVRWGDEIFGTPGALDGNVEPAALSLSTDLSSLTKSQRKKERRRLRKAAGDSQGTETTPTSHRLAVSSDADSDFDLQQAQQQSTARKNIIQSLVDDTPTKQSKKLKETLGNTASPHVRFLQQVREQSAITNTTPTQSRYSLRSHARAAQIYSPSHSQDETSLTEAFTRKAELLSLLHQRFDLTSSSSLQLIRSNPTSPHPIDPAGIHIFVDISNILIGLHDAIKASMGLKPSARLPRQHLNFHNFSLVLERGRACAKKVLAGSDVVESVTEAQEIGYELNILERVEKVREMTARQRFFAAKDASRASGTGTEGGATSESDGQGLFQPTQLLKRRVEQGVDEILHLKILESLLDYARPSTIVLATGDAAEAEYSQGFLRMCERALQKGWRVELVSFRLNMSQAYRKKTWRARWGDRFEIVELDEFVQGLRV